MTPRKQNVWKENGRNSKRENVKNSKHRKRNRSNDGVLTRKEWLRTVVGVEGGVIGRNVGVRSARARRERKGGRQHGSSGRVGGQRILLIVAGRRMSGGWRRTHDGAVVGRTVVAVVGRGGGGVGRGVVVIVVVVGSCVGGGGSGGGGGRGLGGGGGGVVERRWKTGPQCYQLATQRSQPLLQLCRLARPTRICNRVTRSDNLLKQLAYTAGIGFRCVHGIGYKSGWTSCSQQELCMSYVLYRLHLYF